MKHLLLITIAAVVLVGCGPSASDISIHDAAAGGHIKAIKQHLDSGTEINTKDDKGLTALHWAAERGHKKIVEFLIANDADVNALVDREKVTPLHYVGSKEVAKMLIDAGSNVNAKDHIGNTPLDYHLLDYRLKEMADFFRKHGGKTGEELKAEGK